MRVKNDTDHPVFVKGSGHVEPHEEETVQSSEQVKQLIKQGVLHEVKSTSSGNAESKDGGDNS